MRSLRSQGQWTSMGVGGQFSKKGKKFKVSEKNYPRIGTWLKFQAGIGIMLEVRMKKREDAGKGRGCKWTRY